MEIKCIFTKAHLKHLQDSVAVGMANINQTVSVTTAHHHVKHVTSLQPNAQAAYQQACTHLMHAFHVT